MTTSGGSLVTQTTIGNLSPHLTGTLTNNIATTAMVTGAGKSMLGAGSAASLGGAFGVGSNGAGVANGHAWHNTSNNTLGSRRSSYTNATFGELGSILSLYNADGEVVKLRDDGRVVWKHGIQIDEAAKAFSHALRSGGAMCAGVGAVVKAEIREEMYNSLIALAKEKGILTIEDLTFDRDSCILVEKLANPTEE